MRVPPGRAGRLDLERRLRSARRSADVLDRKLRILRVEQDSLERAAREAEDCWRKRYADADTWLLRAALLGHRRGLLAAERPEAELVLGRAMAAGVGYLVLERMTVPDRPLSAAPPASAASDPAAAAGAVALEAAVRYAVADAALRSVAAEVSITRRRLRAIEDRWLPALTERYRVVVAELDEQERAEGARLRWATRRGSADQHGDE
ncbi:MAG TPA: V-type ATP synthase subunit D [Mycobacteriales bacterium]